MPVTKISRSLNRRQKGTEQRKASDRGRMPQCVQVLKERSRTGTMHLGVFLAVRYRAKGRGLAPEGSRREDARAWQAEGDDECRRRRFDQAHRKKKVDNSQQHMQQKGN